MNRAAVSKLVFEAFVFSLTSGAWAATIRVPADHPAVQDAIDASADGDTVLVAPGEYVLAEPLSLKGKRVTVQSEQGSGETVLRISPASPEVERSSVVVFESGESRESILEGFTLTGGKGTKWGNDFLERGGGGIACRAGSSPTVRDCVINSNSSDKGGGIYCAPGSTPLFQRTRISGNTLAGFFGSPSGGAGVYVAADASPVFEDCEGLLGGVRPLVLAKEIGDLLRDRVGSDRLLAAQRHDEALGTPTAGLVRFVASHGHKILPGSWRLSRCTSPQAMEFTGIVRGLEGPRRNGVSTSRRRRPGAEDLSLR